MLGRVEGDKDECRGTVTDPDVHCPLAPNWFTLADALVMLESEE